MSSYQCIEGILLGWTDSYGIDIKQGEDDVSNLCVCIVIDQVLSDDKKHHHH